MAEKLQAKDIKLTNLVDAINEGNVEVIKFVAKRQPMAVMFLVGLTADQRNVFKWFPDWFSIRRLEAAVVGGFEGEGEDVDAEEEVEEVVEKKASAKKAPKKAAKKVEPEEDEDDEEDEEDEPAPKKKGKNAAKAPAKKGKKVVEEDDEDFDDDDDFEDFE